MRRHAEVMKVWKCLLEKGGFPADEEPLIPSASGVRFSRSTTTTDPEARSDLRVRGLFTNQREAYLDIAVMDTGALSREGRSPDTVLREKETQKRAKYEERIALTGDFAPLVCSVYGTLAPESSRVLSLIIHKMDKEDKESACFLQRVRLQTAIIKATSMCLRSRSAKVVPPCPTFPNAMDDCKVGLLDTDVLRESD